MNHTPPPWMVEPINDGKTFQITTMEATGFQVVCETSPDNSPERQKADAEHIVQTANAFKFIKMIARFTQDGEIVDGEEFSLEADDSIDTLRDLIDQARAIIAGTPQ